MWQIQVVSVQGIVELIWRDSRVDLNAELSSADEKNWRYCVGYMAGYDDEYDWQHHKEVWFFADGLSAAKLHAVSLIPDATRYLSRIMDSKYKNFESQLRPWIGKTVPNEDLSTDYNGRERRSYIAVECRHRSSYCRLRLEVVNNVVTDRIINAGRLLEDDSHN